MKKIYSLLLLTGLILLGAQTVKADKTVYFVNANNWSSVYCHYWQDGVGGGTTWPGLTMTNTGLTKGDKAIYSITFADVIDRCIFHNNEGTQTGDLTVSAGDNGKMRLSKDADAWVDLDFNPYVVVGNSAELFGATWAGTKEENKMTYDPSDGLLKISYSNVLLSFLPEYKFVYNGTSWIPDGANIQLSGYAGRGTYNVSFTLNPLNNEYTGAATLLLAVSSDYTRALINNTVLLTATSHFSDGEISYEFYYSKDEAAYESCGPATTTNTYSFTPTEGGNYTFKVVATGSTKSVEAIFEEIQVADAWTIAGDSVLTGYKWDVTATANNMSMTADDGILTLVQNKRFITAGTHKYKVFENYVDNAAQYPASGDNNYKFNDAGYYNLVYTFDWKNWSLELEATFVAPKVELGGEFNGWHAQEMTTTNGENYTLTLPALTAGEYMFRVRRNEATSWNGTEGDGRMLRTNCKNWELPATGNGDFYNCGLIADLDGEYVFNYVFSTNRLTITYPMTFSRTVANTNYGTLCLPCDASLTGATAYTINELHIGSGYVTLTEVGTSLEAGHAYIIKPEAAGTITAELEGDTVAAPIVDNYICGVWGAKQQLSADGTTFVLYDNKLCKLEGEGKADVTSTKAYLQIPVGGQGAPAVLRIVEGENNATAMENLDAAENTTKFIRNGVLYIIRNGVTYDAMGKQVK